MYIKKILKKKDLKDMMIKYKEILFAVNSTICREC